MDLDQIFYKLPPKLRLTKTSWRSLEPEEIFLDAKKDQGQKMETPIKKRNLVLFFALIIICFGVLAFKSGWMETVKGAFYKSQADKNRLRILPIFAPRGIIYDKNGQQLVYNVPIFDLVTVPAYLPQDKNEKEAVINEVSQITGKDKKEISQKLADVDIFSFEPVIIDSEIERDKVLALETKSAELTGFSLIKNLRREYKSSPYFSHLIGYMGRMSAQDIKNYPDYYPTELIGKSGLETQYENILRTLPGRQETEVNARGEIKNTSTFEESKDVKSLVLSIDADLQKYLYEQIEKTLKGLGVSRAAAAAINPQNGQVLSLISFPSFDNNSLVKGISKEAYDDLINNPDQPLFNRVIAGQYPPGSTIKPFVAAAALQEKIIKPSTTVNDVGPLTIPNPYNPEIVYSFPDWKTHGLVNVYSAIAQSCNVYFYHIGGGFGDIKGLGIGLLEKYLKLFGFGQKTGIDLPGEGTGFAPDAKWKEEIKKEQWYIGDTYHFSIGQGDLTATPLQMAVLTAAIANGGEIWQPRIVDKIVNSEKNTIQDIEPAGRQIDFVSKENLGIIREAMRQTILSGSAQSLKNLKVEVAGKTGTAQVYNNKQTNAWFTAFAPYGSPEIVLAILIEEGGEGSSAAVPIAKNVLEWYFNK